MARRQKSRRHNPHPCSYQTNPNCRPTETCHDLTTGFSNKANCVPHDHCRYENVSCGDLRRRYLMLLDAPPTELTWHAIWHLFVSHGWFQERLERCARSALHASFLSDQWVDDVKQEVMLRLTTKLQRIPDLRIDRAQAETRFAGWLHTIILRDCRLAVRWLRRLHYRTLPLLEDRVGDEPSTALDARLDFNEALKQLDDRESSIMLLYAQGYTIREIAAALGFSSSKACRLIRHATAQVAQRLLPDDHSSGCRES